MADSQINDYIKKQREAGVSENDIRKNLVKSGWSEDQINSVFNILNAPPPPPPAHSAKLTMSPIFDNADKPTQTQAVAHPSMWDAFEHVLQFISLYVLATSIGLLLHQFINEWLPPVTSRGIYDSYRTNYQSTLIRGYLAAIIVSFPLFSYFFLQINKRTIINPELRNLKARKVLIYLTLILTFLIMIASVIQVVFSLLSGNISLNFLFHFLVTVGISSLIFFYYVNQVKDDKSHA